MGVCLFVWGEGDCFDSIAQDRCVHMSGLGHDLVGGGRVAHHASGGDALNSQLTVDLAERAVPAEVAHQNRDDGRFVEVELSDGLAADNTSTEVGDSGDERSEAAPHAVTGGWLAFEGIAHAAELARSAEINVAHSSLVHAATTEAGTEGHLFEVS